jgi:hypothetical protein
MSLFIIPILEMYSSYFDPVNKKLFLLISNPINNIIKQVNIIQYKFAPDSSLA